MRYWELDLVRGIAVAMMILFHFIFDLYYFLNYQIPIYSGFWFLFARITAGIFIFLVGINFSLSYSRNPKFSKSAKRGIKTFFYGLLITFATWAFFSQGAILFGILHFIGVSVIFLRFFIRFNNLNLVLAAIFMAIGFLVINISADSYFLLPFGITPTNFYTFDYFPILPWFGVALLGMFSGKKMYNNGRNFRIKDLSTNFIVRKFSFLGRNSLIIYFIHQPILMIILYLLGFDFLSYILI